MDIIKKIKKAIKNNGIINIFRSVIESFFFNILRIKYKFDKWHASYTFSYQPYKRKLVNLCNSIKIDVAAEIGCGLGEIIGRINCSKKYGFDNDENVLNAAKFLWGKKVSFRLGSFLEFYNEEIKKIDLVIICNWIHNIKPILLKKSIEDICKKIKVKYLIMDSIKKNKKGYKYHHDINKIIQNFGVVAKICDDGGEGIRTLNLIKID